MYIYIYHKKRLHNIKKIKKQKKKKTKNKNKRMPQLLTAFIKAAGVFLKIYAKQMFYV